MATNFIPPIPIGQFRPSSEAIASWLYEVWKYLQEHPIPSADDITGDAEEVAENCVTVNVPPMIASAISALQYSDFVNDTTLPVYRASNDEIDNPDLLEAWNEGCRFALVDDESFFVMIKNGENISLLQILTEEQATGVISVNGQTGIVVLKTSDLQNDSGFITLADIPTASTSAAGLMSATDKTKLDDLSGAQNMKLIYLVRITSLTINIDNGYGFIIIADVYGNINHIQFSGSNVTPTVRNITGNAIPSGDISINGNVCTISNLTSYVQYAIAYPQVFTVTGNT